MKNLFHDLDKAITLRAGEKEKSTVAGGSSRGSNKRRRSVTFRAPVTVQLLQYTGPFSSLLLPPRLLLLFSLLLLPCTSLRFLIVKPACPSPIGTPPSAHFAASESAPATTTPRAKSVRARNGPGPTTAGLSPPSEQTPPPGSALSRKTSPKQACSHPGAKLQPATPPLPQEAATLKPRNEC